MQPSEITSFLQKFAAGTYTEAEHQQFTDWLKSNSISEVESVMEQYQSILYSVNTSSQAANQRTADRIEAAIDQYELGKESLLPEKRAILLPRYFRIAATVILFIGAGIATLLFLRKDKPANSIAVQQPLHKIKTVVTPGGNKAILTLGDGSVISLEDASNGKIAKQGSTTVNKASNGQLVYEVENHQAAEIVFNTLTTPRGGQFKLILPDGSVIWLNAASSIKYPTAFSGHERKVEITGEAYFEITHDASMPFIVSANGMEIKVLGTHFNVNAYNDEASVKTTLLEGSVSLTRGSAAVSLQPGQQAQLPFNGDFKVVNDVDLEEVVAWKNGYFSFNKSDLKTVMRQIARWYDVDIRYEGKIPERYFGGKIDRSSNASEVLKILEESKIHFSIEDKKIIVKP